MPADQSDTAALGYGQQIPTDASDDFNATAFLVSQMTGRMETMKLVQVVAVHGGAGAIAPAGTVDVLPLVNQVDGGGHATTHGTVFGIPWSRVQGGANAVVCDPVIGDVGYVVASDRDISNVKATGKRSNPGSSRRFNIADGVYAGGALNVAPDQYLVFTADGVRLVDKNGNSVAMTAAGITLTDSTGNVVSTSSGGISLSPHGTLPCTVNGNLVVTGNLLLEGNIESQAGGVYAGNLQTLGDITARFGPGAVGLATHTHTQPNDNHGDVEQPTASPTGGT